MLDITNRFIKSGVGWGKKSEKRRNGDRETEKITNFLRSH
jgi:hypothetical protein